jgi:protocatechuate 3,4-dioxygenase beta subunit
LQENDMEPSTTLETADASRRLALGALGSWGMTALLGCGGGGDNAGAGSGTGSGSSTGTGSGTGSGSGSGSTTANCSVVPQETEGPYPADGSTASSATYNVLGLSGIVRSDIRSSIGSSTQVVGVPLTLELTLTNTLSACAPLQGYAIYLWHCTAGGDYSVYTERSLAANYLRGVQATDASGMVRFTTVVPGCYAGRMPHMHLEIYPNLAAASNARNQLRTTQLAFPTELLRGIYAANAAYASSIPNLNAISFARDNVFSDGTALQMTSMQANASGGYTAAITISIAA